MVYRLAFNNRPESIKALITVVRRIIAFLVVLTVLIALLGYSQRRTTPVTVSGYIEADEIRLGSRVGGRVHRVLVEEGQSVSAGELMVELEPYDLMERLAEAEAVLNQQNALYELRKSGYRSEEVAQAEARVDQFAARLEELKNGPRPQEIKAAEADLEFAQAELVLAQEVYDRTKRLHADNAATDEQLDRAVKELRAAQARVQARKEQLDLLKEGTRPEEIAAAQAQLKEADEAWRLMKNGFRQEEISEAYSAMRAAESARDAIQRQIEELKIVAPVAGTVDAVELQPGDLVSPNAPVISLIDDRHLWVRAYVPENRLDLTLGQELPVTVDSYPQEAFQGEVTFISRQAEFTPGNVQTPEERSKQVFRIKVSIQDKRLRPGMAADVWLEGAPSGKEER